MATCPICRRTAKPRAGNPSFPFCGTRCKTIDLGHWANEDYRISSPIASESEGDGGEEDGGSSDGSSKSRPES